MEQARQSKRGFTLIELLIVVAIIAILAAIAVPNFLEAQTRSKVSRSKADMRTQATALEAYLIDYNSYCKDSDSGLDEGNNPTIPWDQKANGIIQLTTPVAYITSILADPFVLVPVHGGGAQGYRIASGSWSYGAWNIPTTAVNDLQGSPAVFAAMGAKTCYAIIGVGPDVARCRCSYKSFPYMPATQTDGDGTAPSQAIDQTAGHNAQPMCWVDYDPTNGTVSKGDIYRFGGNYNEGHFMLNGGEVGTNPHNSAVW